MLPRSLRAVFPLFLLTLLILLPACAPETALPSAYPPPDASAAPSPTLLPKDLLGTVYSPEQRVSSPTATVTLTRTSTVTRTPTSTATATAGPTTTLTAGPSLTPTLTPAGTFTPTPLIIKTGLFRIVFSLKNMSPGVVDAVHPFSGSRAMISGTYGVLELDLMSGDVVELRTPDRLLGIDSSERAWLTPARGARIYSWNGGETKTYEYRNGWILNAAFFDAPLGGSRLVDGLPGEVWLATAYDVRYFNGTRWRVFTATESGIRYTRQAYVNTAIALAVNPNTGEAVAGTCDWRGDRMLDGGSMRRYDGLHWIDAGFPLENPCVNWLKAAADGKIYAAIGGSIWRMDGAGNWDELTLPALSDHRAYSVVEEMPFDLEGRPWPLVRVVDDKGQLVERARFRLDDTGWEMVRLLDQIRRQKLVFLPGGKVWSLEQGEIYSLEESGVWKLRAAMDYRTGAADPVGGIWLVTDAETKPLVWRGLP